MLGFKAPLDRGFVAGKLFGGHTQLTLSTTPITTTATSQAYGQTGSGKTHSIFGGENDTRGVIPRAVETVFAEITKRSDTTETSVVVTFLEMYCDHIRDLGKAYLEEKRSPGSAAKQSDVSVH